MFKGSFVALVTPYIEENVDLDCIAKLVDWHAKSGTNGIVVCGSTGEGLLLSDKERESIIATSIEAAQHRVQIVVGCSYASTKDAICAAKQAESLKADGILVIAPFYVKPNQHGIIQHFAAVHDATNIPIILYNNPARCVVDMSIGTISHLTNTYSRIVALKDSNTDFSRIEALRKACNNIDLLSGDDGTLLGYLVYGGDGAISVIANVAPHDVSQMISNMHQGKTQEAIAINNRLMTLNSTLCIETNPVSIKYAMYKNGLLKNASLRLPLMQATSSITAIDDVLKNIEFS